MRDRSPWLAEALPPTLLPNAVALSAPHPDRMMSLLAACTVYCAMGAALVTGARRVAQALPPPIVETPPVIILTGTPVPAPPVTRVVPPPSGHGGGRVVDPPASPDAVPAVTPGTLPSVDHSGDTVRGGGEGPAVVGPPATLDPPATGGPQAVAAPVEMELRQIQVLHEVAPVYPRLARLAHKEGPVELRLTIDTQGVPTAVDVISGPNASLVEEAVRVARLWRFRPAQLNGAAVQATFRLTVAFRLSN